MLVQVLKLPKQLLSTFSLLPMIFDHEEQLLLSYSLEVCCSDCPGRLDAPEYFTHSLQLSSAQPELPVEDPLINLVDYIFPEHCFSLFFHTCYLVVTWEIWHQFPLNLRNEGFQQQSGSVNITVIFFVP